MLLASRTAPGLLEKLSDVSQMYNTHLNPMLWLWPLEGQSLSSHQAPSLMGTHKLPDDQSSSGEDSLKLGELVSQLLSPICLLFQPRDSNTRTLTAELR